MRLKQLLMRCLFFLPFPSYSAAEVIVPPETIPPIDYATPRDERWMVVASGRAKQIQKNRGGIVVLGDSIAGRWPVPLQEEQFGHRFVNLGIGGDQVENVIWRMKFYDLAAADAKAILIILGTNNLRTEDTPETIFARLETVIAMVREAAPNTPLLVSEILPRGKYLKAHDYEIARINHLINTSGDRMGYQTLPVHDTIVSECSTTERCALFVDFVHPNDDGYRVIGGVLKEVLNL